ncbi:ribose-5-phosphate isomerase RpiA [Paenibacillus sp. GCM10027627]|uniref:ribose-5-phosphate isomerase RpiA n=1 Tax=unclassified Paenibacillus TaxID=185978 RepID=UPI003629D3B7
MNAKKAAAEKAVEFIKNGMVVGLGTGSTSTYAIHRIAERIAEEGLQISAVASSASSERLAVQLGIPIVPFSKVETIDVTIDGADEIDGHFNAIKGGGGALLREKILAAHSRKWIVIVDESKVVPVLGHFPLPIETVPFAIELTLLAVKRLSFEAAVRKVEGLPFLTDNGNYILDCAGGPITNPGDLASRLKTIPGIVETGLFVGMTDTVVVGKEDGTVIFL